MPSFIVKLAEDEYIEWSTIVDAPTSGILGRSLATSFWGTDRIGRADQHGSSCINPEYSMESLVSFNRAGPHETCLTLDEIREHYRDGEGVPGPKHMWTARRAFQDACAEAESSGVPPALLHQLLTMYVGSAPAPASGEDGRASALDSTRHCLNCGEVEGFHVLLPYHSVTRAMVKRGCTEFVAPPVGEDGEQS